MAKLENCRVPSFGYLSKIPPVCTNTVHHFCPVSLLMNLQVKKGVKTLWPPKWDMLVTTKKMCYTKTVRVFVACVPYLRPVYLSLETVKANKESMKCSAKLAAKMSHDKILRKKSEIIRYRDFYIFTWGWRLASNKLFACRGSWGGLIRLNSSLQPIKEGLN